MAENSTKIKLQIVTPERVLLQTEVDSLTCPTTTGQITILPGHIPLVSTLEHGELIARVEGEPQYIAISGGFVEIRDHNEVAVLADTAERAHEIDEKRAEEARIRAEQAMKNASTLSAHEYASIAANLQKNLTRLKVARKHSHHTRVK
jgi:F-type H+-transporting ATPase subunit epsilon